MDPFKEVLLPNGDRDPKLFSFKMKGPGLNYEIVIGLYTGRICRIKGPYPAGEFPDLKLAQRKGLVRRLQRYGERCIADGTYRNEVFINSGPGLNRKLLEVIRFAKARHETVNERLKEFYMFRLLRGFRHDMETHKLCFHAIANILEISLETDDRPLFSIREQLEDFDEEYEAEVGGA